MPCAEESGVEELHVRKNTALVAHSILYVACTSDSELYIHLGYPLGFTVVYRDCKWFTTCKCCECTVACVLAL